jgi:hypothetical protein
MHIILNKRDIDTMVECSNASAIVPVTTHASGNESRNTETSTKTPTETTTDLRINLQRIAVLKSAFLLELVGIQFDNYKELLRNNLDKTLNLTSIFIELQIIYFNSQMNKTNIKQVFVKTNIPVFLMRHLFEKSLLKNTNKYCDMCITLHHVLDISKIDNVYKKSYEELVHIKHVLTLLELNDYQFVVQLNYDTLVQFYERVNTVVPMKTNVMTTTTTDSKPQNTEETDTNIQKHNISEYVPSIYPTCIFKTY